jgi:hypothetical protein
VSAAEKAVSIFKGLQGAWGAVSGIDDGVAAPELDG